MTLSIKIWKIMGNKKLEVQLVHFLDGVVHPLSITQRNQLSLYIFFAPKTTQ